MQLVRPDDPILHRFCRPDFTIHRTDLDQMLFLMRENNGLGLAASQVGIDARLFVTDWGEVFVNPLIVQRFGNQSRQEGCLSLPNITRRKSRDYQIILADGQTYNGLRAAVIQHEIDHLDGILITDED